MNIQENQIIGELVAKDYRTASIFKKYGIDFCCMVLFQMKIWKNRIWIESIKFIDPKLYKLFLQLKG